MYDQVSVLTFVFTKKNSFIKTIEDDCRDRYNNMFVTLKAKNGSILAEKSTSGKHGEPYLAQDRENIVVPFDSINSVGVITISFRDGTYGQIRSLSVEGIRSGSNLAGIE